MNPNDFTPGIYPNVPELDYHARRFSPADSLSSTEAKRILTAPAGIHDLIDQLTEEQHA